MWYTLGHVPEWSQERVSGSVFNTRRKSCAANSTGSCKCIKRSETWHADTNGMEYWSAWTVIWRYGPCHRPRGGGAVGVLQIDGVVATSGARGHLVETRLVGKSHRGKMSWLLCASAASGVGSVGQPEPIQLTVRVNLRFTMVRALLRSSRCTKLVSSDNTECVCEFII